MQAYMAMRFFSAFFFQQKAFAIAIEDTFRFPRESGIHQK
jgi:hypothetical protein